MQNEKEAQNKVAEIQEQEQSHKVESAVSSFLTQLKNTDNKVSELKLILKAE
ncbi:hypothetical protein J5893_02670 [bacterium]|nr:hypothetical protein [bacterium]